MLVIILAIFMFSIFSIVGLVLVSLFDGNSFFQENKSEIFLLPLIGGIGLVCLLETTGLILNVKTSSWLVIGILIFSAIVCRHRILNNLKNLGKNVFILLSSIVPIGLFAFPVWRIKDLVSVHFVNNDMIYYLADMDWFSEHTLWEKPIFSDVQPYFYVTNNMVERSSRVGFDYLGAFFKNILGLEPHQVFYAYCIALAAVLVFISVYCVKALLKAHNITVGLVCILSILSLNMIQLISMQYGPQIFGMACFIGLIACTTKMYQKPNKKWVFFSALMISGEISIYSELAFHIFVVYIMIFIAYCITNPNIKECLNKLWLAIKTGIIGLVLCVPGTVKAIGYIMYLLNELVTSDSLNADGWIVVENSSIFGTLFGFIFPPVKTSSYSFGNYGMIFCILMMLLGILCAEYILIKHINFERVVLCTITGFLLAYELYFILSNFDYGEFKHLISIVPVVLIFSIYFITETVLSIPQKYVRTCGLVVIYLCAAVICIGNVYQIKNVFSLDSYSYYGSELMDLRQQVNCIESENGFIYDGENNADATHKIIYALKDCELHLPGNSYYYEICNKELNDDAVLIYNINDKGNPNIDITNQYGQDILKVGDYRIVMGERGIGVEIKEGFHEVEVIEGKIFRWTSENESYFNITNYSEEKKEIKLVIELDDSPDGTKTVQLLDQEDKIYAKGKTSEKLVSEYIEIESGDTMEFKLYSEEDLSIVSTGDSREFGVMCYNIEVRER